MIFCLFENHISISTFAELPKLYEMDTIRFWDTSMTCKNKVVNYDKYNLQQNNY